VSFCNARQHFLYGPTDPTHISCNGTKVVYNTSVIWGTVGPQRMFQSGQVYHPIVYFFLIGVSGAFWVVLKMYGQADLISPCHGKPVVTVGVYLLYRRYPKSWLRFVNVPIL
jgi:hypothetical protein